MMNQQGINQAPVQYVMMGNQMVAVQAIYPQQQAGQPMGAGMYPTFIPNQQGQQFQPVQGIPMGYAPPQQVVCAQIALPNPGVMMNPNLNQTVIDEYRKNVTCYVLTYLFLFIPCIILQYVLYGSIVAARLWISSYVFLCVTLAFFHARQEKIQIWNVRTQMIFLTVSLILEIIAFAVAASHPVLYDYFKDSYYAVYNNRRRLYSYDEYESCYDLYYSSSQSEYDRYYASYCDPILGRSSSNNDDESSYYDDYYGTYSQDYKNNMCTGYYDPYRSYCFPLQIGILVYEIFNLIFYLILYFALVKRIRQLFLVLKTSHIVGVNNPQTAQGQQQIISQQPFS